MVQCSGGAQKKPPQLHPNPTIANPMYHITETKKQNCRKAAEELANRTASYAPLRDGTILLRFRNRARVLVEKTEIAAFLQRVKNASPNETVIAVEACFA